MITRTIRVLIVEDHALVRAGIHALLDRLQDVEVVGDAKDGNDALELIDKHVPDVVLMDITMPRMSGLQTLTRVSHEYPKVKVIILSMHDNEEYVFHALHAGAAGYMLKDSAPGELEFAVRSVAEGGSYLSPAVSRHVVADYLRRVSGEKTAYGHLSPRQMEIVQLIAEGHTNREIAQTLGISIKTVETHRNQLMTRLELHDVAGIVRYAMRMGLVPTNR